jgi:hypothetical protein
MLGKQAVEGQCSICCRWLRVTLWMLLLLLLNWVRATPDRMHRGKMCLMCGAVYWSVQVLNRTMFLTHM